MFGLAKASELKKLRTEVELLRDKVIFLDQLTKRYERALTEANYKIGSVDARVSRRVTISQFKKLQGEFKSVRIS